jgi:hypothetical protein
VADIHCAAEQAKDPVPVLRRQAKTAKTLMISRLEHFISGNFWKIS